MIKIDRTIESVENLRWDNEEHSTFTCTVKFAEFNEAMPFTVNPNDIYEHSKIIWENGTAGKYGIIKEFDK